MSPSKGGIFSIENLKSEIENSASGVLRIRFWREASDTAFGPDRLAFRRIGKD